jgi:gamma-glutamylcyclotransferase (GGCT)/AIG2-like uncharacterized protein YtfP
MRVGVKLKFQGAALSAMLLFAYGSTLSTKLLRQYCPTAVFQMKAELPNYRIVFPFYSLKRQGGISSIIHAPGELVYGVLYEVNSKELEDLDIIENVPQGNYVREEYLVLGEDRRWHKAELYRCSKPAGTYTAARSYVEQMAEGAEEHKLNPEYVKELRWLIASLN